MKNTWILATLVNLFLQGEGLERGLTTKELDEVEIEKEYRLIQQKKSSLSANARRLIVLRFTESTKKDNN